MDLNKQNLAQETNLNNVEDPAFKDASSHLDEAVLDIIGELERLLPKKQLDIIKRISFYVSESGLELKEACLLAGVDYNKMQLAISKSPELERLMVLKRLSFKFSLLKVMRKKAIEKGDEKMAQTLLEMSFPDDFGKFKKQQGNENDPLNQALEFLSEHGDAIPLVHESTGAGTKKRDINSLIRTIGELLK